MDIMPDEELLAPGFPAATEGVAGGGIGSFGQFRDIRRRASLRTTRALSCNDEADR
jgi:hypothetical protein